MKKRLLVFITAIIFSIFSLNSCSQKNCSGDNPPPEPSDVIVVQVLKESIDIKDTQVSHYKYNDLFKILVNNVEQVVLDSYIDFSQVQSTPGKYEVFCKYKEESATLKVNVVETIYDLTLSKEEITLKQSASLTYDYLSLFSASIDGVKQEIKEEQIETNLKNEEGTYQYTVRFNGIVKTLTIHIIPDHHLEVILSYPICYLEISQVATFDYTQLFSLYIDYQATQIDMSMIDISSIANPVIDTQYQIVFEYQMDEIRVSETAIVQVVEDEQIVITAKHVVTYPNDAFIDLKSLFEIKKGDEIIPVTSDMIEGAIDYSKAGNSEIKLTYQGQEVVAIVEVRLGVVIDYHTSDTIIIKKGTNQQNYAFENDFEVTINGIRFDQIQSSYFDLSEVDFDNVGTYQVTLTIPYNDKALSLSGVKWTYYEKTIEYIVVENEYKITIKDDDLIINKDDLKYNIYSNLEVIINNRNQTLVENKDYVDIISCYVELLSDPIDYNDLGRQLVEIAVYVNGPNNEPVIVSYTVTIKSELEVIASDKAIFTGTTLYTKDLFKIVNGKEEIEVTNEMISGKVDCFTPGIYYVTISYQGIEKTSKVVVFDNKMMGTYKTNLTTIPQSESTEEDDYGTQTEKPTILGDFIVSDDGTMILSGTKLELIGGNNETTMQVMYGRNIYNLYYIEPGIVVFIPLNEMKMSYNDNSRPMIYFNDSVWSLEDRVVINSTSLHVLQLTYTGYSIDLFQIKSKLDNTTYWYGLRIALVEKNSVDTVYEVSYGEVQFVETFDQFPGSYYHFEFKEDRYYMQLQTPTLGKIQKENNEKKYANTTFVGTYNGKEATLVSDSNEGFSLIQDSVRIFNVTSYEISKMKNGGVNYFDDTLLIYTFEENIYSYKFILNLDDKTFTYIEKDSYYGLYETDDMYLFFDGYGSGHFNPNNKSYQEELFNYIVIGDSIELQFKDSKQELFHGYHAKFYIDAFGNVLTTNYLSDETKIGTRFINNHITKGAIVNIYSYQIGQDSDSVAKSLLYDNIEIITKDGILSKEEMKNCIDVSKVRFNTPGFYQFSIKINIDGKDVIAYYAIQVLEDIYSSNSIATTYGNGIIFNQNSLSIDKYGQVVLNCAGTIYKGNIKIHDDNSFIINAKDENNKKIVANGNQITDGLIILKCSGAINFQDYYTTGTYKITGCENHYLRRITVNNENIYIYSSILNGLGEIVTVTSLNDMEPSQIGSINEIVTSQKEIVVKINSWESTTTGLTISDPYRGTYTNEDSTIIVSGFNHVIVDGVSGEYILNDNVITVMIQDKVTLYRLNNQDYTFEKLDIILDNSIVEGKTFSASHKFVCDIYSYVANTTFTFQANGEVCIVSTSSEHDSGNYACENDVYHPSFASSEGVIGTYVVNNNKLTIKVNGETFVFLITNVLDASEIISLETTINSDEHGYFANNTTFKRQ